jgi:hypothetical protein
MSNTDNAAIDTRTASTIGIGNGLMRLILFISTVICISAGVGLIWSEGAGFIMAGIGFFAVGCVIAGD